tara:strand:+ start:564 stop:1367 length:804 start_codon:yes stop_codon:yes gene_type:complete
MASHLSRVAKGGAMKPIRALIHGHPGTGKTTFAVGSPKPIFIDTEGGLGLLSADAFPAPQSFDEVMDQVLELTNEDHDYRTLVIDAVDGIEPMLFEKVCADGGKSAIADFGFNKGYVQADALWVEFFKRLDNLRTAKAMNIMLLSHSQAAHYDDPTVGTYVRWEPNLHKRTVPLLTKWSDLIAFMDMERIALDKGEPDKNRSVRTTRTTGSRFLHVEGDGSFIAKNRFGLSGAIPIPAENGWSVLAEQLKAAYGQRGTTTNNEEEAA